MNTCKTCKHWVAPTNRDDWRAHKLCNPLDPNDFRPMQRGFEVRACQQPTQTFAESPVERNGFGMVDASEYYAVLVTAEDFGCVRHEDSRGAGTPPVTNPAAPWQTAPGSPGIEHADTSAGVAACVTPKNDNDALLIDNLFRACLGRDSAAIDTARMELRRRMNELRSLGVSVPGGDTKERQTPTEGGVHAEPE